MKECDELELQVNAEEMCRTCLSQLPTNQLKPIFCNEILDGQIIPFPRVLEFTMGMKPIKSQVFPKNVCTGCKTKLRDMFSFKEKVSKSQDLLYEIFGVDRPLPEPPKFPNKPETTTSAVQTDEIKIREENESQYNGFLTIERAPKPITKETSSQVKPEMQESSSQAEPIFIPSKSVSIQVTPAEKPVQHSEVQVDIKEILLEADLDDNSYIHLDVIEEIDDQEEIPESEEQLLEEIDMTEDTIEHDLIGSHDKSSKISTIQTIKLESITEQDSEPEYLTYEVIDAPVTAKSETIKQAAPRNPAKECKYCKYVTVSKSSFNDHNAIHQQSLENVFDKADYFRCTNCKSVYATYIDLEAHFNGNPCAPIDPNDFTASDDTSKHVDFYENGLDVCLPKLKSFYKDVDERIVCSKCTLSFETLPSAVQHYASIHEGEEDSQQDDNDVWEDNGYHQIHVCGICDEQFTDASFIRQHVYFHRTWFECPYGCTENYGDFYKMTIHINRMHLSGNTSALKPKDPLQSEMVCSICFKRFTSKASFKVHTKNHFADRRYACTMCPKAFIQKSDLTIHIRSHTDERPFSCTVAGCDKKFRTTSHRRDHMSTHAEVKKYQCEVCQKYFKAERILQGHLRLHSGFKPFECEQCGKSFSRKHHVKLHMKTHEKDKE